ncbi:hypothetical protein V5799_025257 [Amblyomma americanum]|uniref:Methyltransferase type 11 domain-containing protein n=1 Tax=Amblyomma americanum TaxID=6943 RepID=A0AAQ4E9S2_AMBAM
MMAALDDVESHDTKLRSQGAVRVLEIGAGLGVNFPFVRRKIEYWNIDPNAQFHSGLLEAIKRNPKVQLERNIVGYGEDMHQIPDGHFDVVLTSHLLCSVSCPEKVLQECKRVLVKGGRLLFMEHVAQPKGTVARFLQDLIAPIWWYSFCGCCPNRTSGEVIKNAGFAKVHMKEAQVDLPCVVSRQMYGYAVA